jgi:multidrug efflux pump subunit AcrA (membrane-fusion protein)
MRDNFRKISIVAGVVIPLFIAAFAYNFLSSQKAPPKKKGFTGNDARRVEVIVVENNLVPSTLDVQGRLVAYDKIDILAEVSGILEPSSSTFKVGSRFAKGSVMLKIDSEEAKLNLLSQKSTLQNAITQLMPDLKIDYPESFEHWVAYLQQFDIEKPIQAFPEPLNDKEKFFIATRNIHSQYYNIKSAETRLSKYNIYAPFSGVITEASINPGSLVRVGQKLGELMNTNNYELEATIRLADLNYIKVGSPVSLHSDDIDGNWNGRIKRISDQIDANTQTVIVYIGVTGKSLKEGMYLRGGVKLKNIENAFEIQRDLLVEQSKVYKIENDSLLALQDVEVVKSTENTVIVKGLKNGTPLLKEVFPGIFEGMVVEVKNDKNVNGSNTSAQK